MRLAQRSLGVVGPVDAGGLIVRTVVAFVQNKGIELPPLPRSVVHQRHVFLRHYELPGNKQDKRVNAERLHPTQLQRIGWYSPAVGREADAADGFVEVEVMQDGSGDEADQQRCAVCCVHENVLVKYGQNFAQNNKPLLLPSSTTIAKLPSGETPTQVMFLVVETGNVSDVLLKIIIKKYLTTYSTERVYFTPRTYFFRLKTEIRFPTGLITALPSVEKFRFPWR